MSSARRVLTLLGASAVALRVAPAAAWACSGPGAAAAIGRASLVGLVSFVLALVLAIVGSVRLWRRGRRRRTWPLGLLVVLHPNLWISPISGDCGATLQLAAIVVALLAPGILWLCLRGTRPR